VAGHPRRGPAAAAAAPAARAAGRPPGHQPAGLATRRHGPLCLAHRPPAILAGLRCDDLEHQYAETSWTLGCGLLHGDAYHENIIHTRDGPVLADWDSVSHGPREQDLVATKMRTRFGEPPADWDQFCQVYGFDPDQLPGLPVLLQMRELRALAAYLRSPSPAAQPEVAHRLTDLMTGTQTRPWTALNLAT
jgi:Ser/Thr protein kinase RdoA (MazF antagonist)